MNTQDKMNDPNGTCMPDHAPNPTEQELVLQCKIDGYKNLVKRLQSLLAAEMENLSLTSQAFYESDKKHSREKSALRKQICELERLVGCDSTSDEPLKIYEIHYTNTSHTPSFVVAENEQQARAKVNRSYGMESDFTLSETSVTGYYQFGNNAITM